MSTILITGTAGFIGFHTAKRLLAEGHTIIGFDNLNPYYDVRLKHARLRELDTLGGYTHITGDLADKASVEALFVQHKPTHVIHLAAQAGVRYSLEAPQKYIDSNITGFLNILEAARKTPPQHLVYASSSSIYGANIKIPFAETDVTDSPVSLYGATKKANELMAHAYADLYKLPLTGLRFFTVYGPWGRPDMAYFKFAQAIMQGKPIDVYNHGDMQRDFTYIDDIVKGVVNVALKIPPHRIYNIGNNQPVKLLHMIEVLENLLGKKAQKNMLPMQPGDVLTTYANVDALMRDTGFAPATTIEEGLGKFVEWFKAYSP